MQHQSKKHFVFGMAAAFLLAAAPLAASAEGEYQFIISGYPAANNRSLLASGGISLDTGAYRVASAAGGFEARFRTRRKSSATALDTTEYHGIILILR